MDLGADQAPTNRIITLKRYNFMAPILKTFQYFFKAPVLPPMSACHLQLEKASTIHLDQKVKLFRKGHRVGLKPPSTGSKHS